VLFLPSLRRRRAVDFAMLPHPICGRYTLTMDKSTIKKHFGAKFYIAADLRLVADV
jgi:hypothetical protein